MFRGFTLIELVLVVALLSILAVAALPRFSDLSTQATRSTVTGTAASFQDAVILVQATRIAKGLPRPTNNVADFGTNNVDISSNGYPADTASTAPANNNTVNATKCVNLWSGLLQNPPTITTSAAAYSTTVPQTYRAQAASTTVCRYTYRPAASPVRRFDYSIVTGTVTVTNP